LLKLVCCLVKVFKEWGISRIIDDLNAVRNVLTFRLLLPLKHTINHKSRLVQCSHKGVLSCVLVR
jgi:hypothetical protein